MKKYTMILVAVLLVLGAGFVALRREAPARAASTPEAAAELPSVTVYKSPTCGCCAKWVDHLRQAGFAVEAVDTMDMGAVKEKLGVPANLSSCHTAVVGDYVVEGHVPADVIKQLLDEKPAGVGLAVPGMPIGSPGMEQGDRKDPYEVILFARDGGASVYARR